MTPQGQPQEPESTPERSGWLRQLAADTAACIRFFSRLPLPAINKLDDPAAVPDFRRIARAMPLAGAVTGLIPALVLGLLSLTALPALAIATLAVMTAAAVTGALHEDGLADVADGFFGGATPERRLEIMKDSRIGAFGAMALMLFLTLRITLTAALLERTGAPAAMLVLVAAEMLSRTLMLWQWTAQPSARPDGLGARFGVPGPGAALEGGLFTLLVFLCLFSVQPVFGVILGLGLAVYSAVFTAKLALKAIGGITGDVLGAIQQVTLTVFLCGLLAWT